MTEDPARRCQRLLSRLQDPTLLVLKGHLLIEEQLDYLLSKAARAPERLKDARLSFAQKLALVEALSGQKGDAIGFARALNKLRNDLAHRADADDLPDRIDGLLRRWNPNAPQEKTLRERAAWIRAQIVFVCGRLNGFADGFHAAQANSAMQADRPAAGR